MNIVNFPLEKESTPEELFSILNAEWEREYKIYKGITYTITTIFLICIGIGVTLVLLRNDSFFNAPLILLPMISGFAVIYIFIQLKLKPKKPTMNDAFEWREFKDKVAYQKTTPDSIGSKVIPF
jgi:hypothetical protein